MKVINVKGSSSISSTPPSPCTSWLNYYERATKHNLEDNIWGDGFFICPACGAGVRKRELFGCHVQKYNDPDKSWYIVPLCESCNHRTDSFNISYSLVPVPSNM